MSIPVQPPPTPAAMFQSHFGTPPGMQDAKTECERWERLCAELLAERAQLKSEIEQMRLEQIMREWDATPIPPTWDAALAIADQSTSLEKIIEEMQHEVEAQG